MFIDSHTHVGLNDFCKEGTEPFKYDLQNTPEDFISFMDENCIDKSVILPIPGSNYDSKKSNDYLYQATIKYPNRFIPFCKLDSELAINLMCKDFYGAKHHMVYENFKKKDLHKYYSELAYYGFPLIIHAKFADKINQIKSIISIVPNLKIIVAHMGRGHIYTDEMCRDLLDEFKNNSNILFETSTVGRSGLIEYACHTIGSNRLMFGSDYPFGKVWFKNMFLYSDEYDSIRNANISEEDKRNIFSGTISNLLYNCDERRKGFYVRPIVSSDKDILKSLIATLSEKDRAYLALDKKINIVSDCIRRCKHIYVAIDNNEMVGFFRESGRPNNTYMLEEIAIFNNHRGKGYSRLIMEYFTMFFPASLAKTHTSNKVMNRLLLKFNYIPDSGVRITNWERNV